MTGEASADLPGARSVADLEAMARRCRRSIVTITSRAGAGHPGGSLSVIDILVALYGSRLRVRAEDPTWADRDRLILSKGHASPAMYAILAERGFIAEADLASYRVLDGVCQGHVDMHWTPGVDFSAGSLGMGLSFGLGCSLAATFDGSDRTAWVILGDGELQEGQNWEAVMAARHHEVSNLNVIVDRNRIQNDDFVDHQLRLFDVAEKFRGFEWAAREVDGHSMEELLKGIAWLDGSTSGPAVLVAHTTKGKGVSFMENEPKFHGMAATPEQLAQALEELV